MPRTSEQVEEVTDRCANTTLGTNDLRFGIVGVIRMAGEIAAQLADFNNQLREMQGSAKGRGLLRVWIAGNSEN